MGNPFDFATQNDPGVAAAQGNPMQAGPPANATELQARKSGWDQFLTALGQPGVAEAMLQAGAVMMQPVPMGGSQGGQLGKGMSTFATSLSNSQDKAVEQDQRQQSINIAKDRNAIAREDLGIQRGRLGIEQNNASANLEVLHEQLKAAIRANSPEQIQMATDKYEAELAKIRAEAGASQAQGRYYDAKAQNPNADQSVPGEVQLVRDRAAALRAANPQLTEGQATIQAQDELRKSRTGDMTPEEFVQKTFSAAQNAALMTGKPMDYASVMQDAIAGAQSLYPNWKPGVATNATPDPTVVQPAPAADPRSGLSAGGKGKPAAPQAEIDAFLSQTANATPAQLQTARARWQSTYSTPPPR